MVNHVLVAEDFVAADEAIRRDAERVLAGMVERRSGQSLDRQHLAQMHARFGHDGFALWQGLRPARHRLEEWQLELWAEKIDKAEYQRRVIDEKQHLTLDVSIAQAYYDELGTALFALAKLRQTVATALQDIANRELLERRADRYAADAKPRHSILPDHIALLYKIVPEIRLERQLPSLTIGTYRSTTAMKLADTVLRDAHGAWNRFREIANGSSGPDSQSATEIFETVWSPRLPGTRDLQFILEDEGTLVRTALRSLAGASGRSESKFQTPQIDAPAAEPEHVPVSSEARQSSAESPRVNVRLSDWALGIDEHYDGWLFRKYHGRWDQRSKISIPKGNPRKVLEALARGEGVLSRDDAVDLFRHIYPDKGLLAVGKVVTDALAKLKPLIRKAIAAALDHKLEHVDNPIPFEEPGWRAEIAVGYAVKDDSGRMTFLRKSEMETP